MEIDVWRLLWTVCAAMGRFVVRLDYTEWMFVLVAAVILGFLMLRGFSPQLNA